MRREEIDEELKDVSFELFYWFSRFEFALKENRYLKNHEPNSKAEPSWDDFVEKFKNKYQISFESKRLVELHPKRQIVSANQELDWKKVGTDHCKSELCKVVVMLHAVRNNLFHGGKHGDIETDDKLRNKELLKISKLILDQLADLGNLSGDYTRSY